jgi:hypothetical protein
MQALSKAGLKDRIKWKISCRVDDLDSDILDGMLEHGLIGVYLGVESGNQRGLRTLNKLVSVEQNLNAIDLLKRYDVAMAIGFMLFDPSSTITTVRENINFLRISGNDGYFPVNFCKMLPYAGTRIESQLRQSGRLKGTAARPDYDFLDPRLNWYAFLVHRIFNQRNFHPHGLVARLQQATFDCKLSFSLSGKRHDSGYEDHLRHLVARCNDLAIQTLETLLDAYESPGYDALIDEKDTLVKIAENEWRGEAGIESELLALEVKQ